MSKISILHRHDDLMEIFVGYDTEDILSQVKVFLLNGYLKPEEDMHEKMQKLSMTIKYVDVDLQPEEIQFVGEIRFGEVYDIFPVQNENEVLEKSVNILKKTWDNYDPALSDLENAEAFTEEHGYEAFNYYPTPHGFYKA